MGASTAPAAHMGGNILAGVAGGAPATRVAVVAELGLAPNVHGISRAARTVAAAVRVAWLGPCVTSVALARG